MQPELKEIALEKLYERAVLTIIAVAQNCLVTKELI